MRYDRALYCATLDLTVHDHSQTTTAVSELVSLIKDCFNDMHVYVLRSSPHIILRITWVAAIYIGYSPGRIRPHAQSVFLPFAKQCCIRYF